MVKAGFSRWFSRWRERQVIMEQYAAQMASFYGESAS